MYLDRGRQSQKRKRGREGKFGDVFRQREAKTREKERVGGRVW